MVASGCGAAVLDPTPLGAPVPPEGPAGTEPTENGNCGSQEVTLDPQPAQLVLVLDRSGSMLENLRDRRSGRFVQKWTEVVGALDAVVDTTDSGLQWGLQLYPMPDGCAVSEGLTVPLAAQNHSAVLAGIRSNPAVDGTGATPTAAAVRQAAAALRASTAPGARYLVLATDGQPTCGGGGNPGEDDRSGAIQAVADAQAAGIGVFVVGVATEQSQAHETLNRMAERGGRARGETTRYYPVGTGEDLVWALESITGQIFACSFPLHSAPPAPDNVRLEIDGQRLARDTAHEDGWDYGEGLRTIVVHGPACDSLRTARPRTVRILYGCR